MFSKAEEPDLTFLKKLHLFFSIHWRGLIMIIVPFALLPIVLPFPGLPWEWCAYTLIVMAIYWVSEALPLPVTGFLPLIIFPLAGVNPTTVTSKHYINDSVLMFIGSIMLAFSVEQCGLHRRLAYGAVRLIGYSHLKLTMAVTYCTMFVSMWITNTAATTMMVPINFALLRVFEEQNILSLYETNVNGEQQATDITALYFCTVTFAATTGGLGTLVGTATNLAFKGLFVSSYPTAPEHLSFPLFSAFSVPYMLVLQTCIYLSLSFTHLGLFRPGSAVAKKSKISEEGKRAAKLKIETDSKKLGKISYWEASVIVLFSSGMLMFFCRSPQLFHGWGDYIVDYFNLANPKYVTDSAAAYFIVFLMFTLPSNLNLFKTCAAKYKDNLVPGPIPSVLDWRKVNRELPYNFMFLLGGGFALSNAARTSGLNDKIGNALEVLNALPHALILFLIIAVVIFVTNFASNVAVATVFTPIFMEVAGKIGMNPLWTAVASGLAASLCMMIPVGTPGNLVVQSVAKIPTSKMAYAGLIPTFFCLIITWFFIITWAPVIWPELKTMPSWAQKEDATTAAGL